MTKIIEALKIGLYAFFTWVGIDIEHMQILVVLMCIDSFTGVMKTIALRNRRFSFNKLLMGLTVKFAFLLIPLAIALMAKQLGNDMALVIHIITSILTVSEGYSIFGNILSAKNKKEFNKIDAVTLVLVGLRRTIKVFLKDSMNKINTSEECRINDLDKTKDDEKF